MHILLVDTTAFAPISPMFGDALDDWCKQHDATWSLLDEAYFSHSIFLRLNHSLELDALVSDVVLIMKGAAIRPESLKRIKTNSKALLVCYATDDPFNKEVCRDNVRDCIPLYDTYVTCKRANVNELYDAGAKDVHYLPVGYKPSIHFPESPNTDAEREKFACDICVIGGADEERMATVKKIIHAFPDKDIFLYGGYWDRDADTAPCARGFAYGRDYRLAIGGAKVCVNLLRSANRDQSNMRTFEIPACGGLMLTELTQEHRELGCAFPVFRNQDEMLEAITELLISPIERNDFLKANHWVKPHTYQARLEQLMALVKVQV